MAEVQIKKMSISHEMILNWLVMNPEKTQNECAEFFGVTPAWLSVVVNSDCFQARWIQRRQMLATGVVALAESKMRGVIDKGLDRLERLVEVSPDPGFVLETTDKLLGRLGYGPKTGPSVQINTQNNYAISRDVLDQARRIITEGGEQREPMHLDQGAYLEDGRSPDERSERPPSSVSSQEPVDQRGEATTFETGLGAGLGGAQDDELVPAGPELQIVPVPDFEPVYPANPFKERAPKPQKLIVPLGPRRFE